MATKKKPALPKLPELPKLKNPAMARDQKLAVRKANSQGKKKSK